LAFGHSRPLGFEDALRVSARASRRVSHTASAAASTDHRPPQAKSPKTKRPAGWRAFLLEKQR
jgi:hypothetical protein